MSVAGKRGIIDENTVTADHAVVTDMDVGHQQVVVADGGFGTILDRTAMNGDALADDIVVADDKTRGLALVFQVRRIFTHGRELVNAVMLADDSRPFYHHMGGDNGALTDLNVGSDDGPGTHLHIRRQASTGMNNSA
jgi:hypothetical protein